MVSVINDNYCTDPYPSYQYARMLDLNIVLLLNAWLRSIPSPRCPKYNSVPASCGTKPDPNDPCCTMPDCPSSVNYVSIPVFGKGLQSIGAVVSPNLPSLMNGWYTARFTMGFDGYTVATPTAPTGTSRPDGLGELQLLWTQPTAVGR